MTDNPRPVNVEPPDYPLPRRPASMCPKCARPWASENAPPPGWQRCDRDGCRRRVMPIAPVQ